MAQPPVFYYDFAAPEAYLAAERSYEALGVVPEWRPVAIPGPPPDEARRGRVEQLAAARELMPIRWPALPLDSELALLAAVYARGIGKIVAFSLAAFRQAYAGGRTLDEDTVLLAAAACEIHPRALLGGVATRTVRETLERDTQQARSAGVRATPAFALGELLFHGEGALEAAAEALRQ